MRGAAAGGALLVALLVALLASPAAAAAAPRLAALPSPLAPLSPSPPLGGGASAAAEGVRHRVHATTRVRVAIDGRGAPFVVTATQRLVVSQPGDYYFTIGAPLTDVARAAGSQSAPGLRPGTIIWAGFNPGSRVLAARATLDPAAVSSLLPLRVAIGAGKVTLINATSITTTAFSADALKPQLQAFLAGLRHATLTGTAPTGGGALVTSNPVQTTVRVIAPLRLTGTIGSRRVSLTLGGSPVSLPAGRVRLSVTVLHPSPRPRPASSGRELLDLAIRASLVSARARQYDAFLGNPDPSGSSVSSFRYVTATRSAPPVVAAPPPDDRGALGLVLWAVGGLAALGAAAVAWARA
jgi:hypothetical protein